MQIIEKVKKDIETQIKYQCMLCFKLVQICIRRGRTNKINSNEGKVIFTCFKKHVEVVLFARIKDRAHNIYIRGHIEDFSDKQQHGATER